MGNSKTKIKQPNKQRSSTTIPPAFGAWKHKQLDGLKYQIASRDEWQHREKR